MTRPRRISSQLHGACADRNSGMVDALRLGRRKNSTGHSAARVSHVRVLSGLLFSEVVFLENNGEWFASANSGASKGQSIVGLGIGNSLNPDVFVQTTLVKNQSATKFKHSSQHLHQT
jgi:hypothetical protein